MSHSPPVPPGNQSPFPLQEPPHRPTPGTGTGRADEARAGSAPPGLLPLLAGAAGIGVIVAAAAALFLRPSRPAGRKKKGKRTDRRGRPKK